jgi:hypothetical protein
MEHVRQFVVMVYLGEISNVTMVIQSTQMGVLQHVLST